MSNLWFNSLQTLRGRFRAGGHPPIYHLFIEVGEGEREFLRGPDWFTRQQPHIVRGGGEEGMWTSFAMSGLPSQSPSFRPFTEADDAAMAADTELGKRIIRDKAGRPRAVFEPQVIRSGYFAGAPARYGDFRGLATACAQALLGLPDFHLGRLPSDLAELCRPGAGLQEYRFGTLANAPKPIPSGWNALVYQEEDGVLIYSPEPFIPRDEGVWLLLLHRLGWRRIPGSALFAQRDWWDGGLSVSFAEVEAYRAGRRQDEFMQKALEGRKTRHFFSVLGTKDAPLDLYVASASAIDVLLEMVGPAAEPPAQEG